MKPASPRRRVDLLAVERAKGLPVEAYLSGVALRDLFEMAKSTGAQPWGDRVDVSCRPDAAVLHRAEVARQLADTMAEVTRLVGPPDAGRLRRVLDEGLSFAELAAIEGKSGERAVGYIAARVRDALQEIGAKHVAVGRVRRRAVDKYSQQSNQRKNA